MRPSDAFPLAVMTGLVIELRARLGAGTLPLAEHWDDDVVSVGRMDPGGVPRLVFVALAPGSRARFDVTLEPGPGHFVAVDVDGVAQLVRQHLGLRAEPATRPAA
jgi:hypothetical protein